ncbi:CsbD family protein [Arthrobacter antioxidans]|uniref:CsbD family protein n=1 Tax=Arthrobacter antioxidans TaxID=2895818 RepID=UPI001FFFB5E5|nr:CsbD family protein [Arthrobacter antioxidans]
MGLDDKIGNAAQKLGGQGKEATGHATGDENLKAEGQGDQAKGDLKQAGEKIKDAFKK